MEVVAQPPVLINTAKTRIKAQIEELAEVYANVKPLATLIGLGPGYWRTGGATVRWIDALGAISGNVGVSGGGVHTDAETQVGLDFSFLDNIHHPVTRSVLLP
jgi:anaerobic selenocysteine-containing dehydrogenase